MERLFVVVYPSIIYMFFFSHQILSWYPENMNYAKMKVMTSLSPDNELLWFLMRTLIFDPHPIEKNHKREVSNSMTNVVPKYTGIWADQLTLFSQIVGNRCSTQIDVQKAIANGAW